MDLLNLLAKTPGITTAALTVRAQQRALNNPDELRHDVFFPRRDVNSIQLATITTATFRPVADRRPWGGRGRYIPVKPSKAGQLEMLPIEAFFSLTEREMQLLAGANANAVENILTQLGLDIPSRTDGLSDADYRRLELDCFEVWRTGRVAVRDPETEQATLITLVSDATRYVTPGAAWTGGSTGTAYTELVYHARQAKQKMGQVVGAVVRQTTLDAIVASAPLGANQGFGYTIADIEERLRKELGGQFQFRVEERTLDVFTDSGVGTTEQKVWNGTEVAFIPAGFAVGEAAFAPVLRAQMMVQERAALKNFADVRGVTVFYVHGSDGKSLEVQAQLNAMPVLDERKVYVVTAGI